MSNIYTAPLKVNFGVKMHNLPNPTINQSVQLKTYAKADLLGFEPSHYFPSSTNFTMNWSTRTDHAKASQSYNQANINYLCDNSPEIWSALSFSVSAFTKTDSELDTGLVVNFEAA